MRENRINVGSMSSPSGLSSAIIRKFTEEGGNVTLACIGGRAVGKAVMATLLVNRARDGKPLLLRPRSSVSSDGRNLMVTLLDLVEAALWQRT